MHVTTSCTNHGQKLYTCSDQGHQSGVSCLHLRYPRDDHLSEWTSYLQSCVNVKTWSRPFCLSQKGYSSRRKSSSEWKNSNSVASTVSPRPRRIPTRSRNRTRAAYCANEREEEWVNKQKSECHRVRGWANQWSWEKLQYFWCVVADGHAMVFTWRSER